MFIPRRIYYEKDNGRIILETGNFYDKWANSVPSTEYELGLYKELSALNSEAFDYIELQYGQYAQDFAECNGYRINPDTKQIEFSYPDPNETEPSEPVYQEPLSEQVAANTDYLLEMEFRLLILEMGI